jgi:hypothetical protein
LSQTKCPRAAIILPGVGLWSRQHALGLNSRRCHCLVRADLTATIMRMSTSTGSRRGGRPRALYRGQLPSRIREIRGSVKCGHGYLRRRCLRAPLRMLCARARVPRWLCARRVLCRRASGLHAGVPSQTSLAGAVCHCASRFVSLMPACVGGQILELRSEALRRGVEARGQVQARDAEIDSLRHQVCVRVRRDALRWWVRAVCAFVCDVMPHTARVGEPRRP